METEISFAKEPASDGAQNGENPGATPAPPERLLASAQLDSLAVEYGTDKGSQYHGYAGQYGRILDPLRRGPQAKAVVEVGVCRKWDGNKHICPSLAMWKDWFGMYGAEVGVIGLDKCEFGINRGGILTLVCDQGNLEHLAAARHAIEKGFGGRGGVDLIVDDGSHEARHQQMTMKALWPCLRVGGAYVIEDLNYNPEHEVPVRRTRGCVEAWQAGMKPAWLVDLRRELKKAGRVDWVDSAVSGKRSAVVIWKDVG